MSIHRRLVALCLTVVTTVLSAEVRRASAETATEPVPACGGTSLIDQAERTDPSVAARIDAATRQTPNAEGLLWKIEKPGVPASYLFGTMHVTDAGAIAIARSTAPYLATTPTVATELGSLNAAVKAVAGVKMGIRALKSKVAASDLIHDPADRAKVGDLVTQLGLKPDTALAMPPWLLTVLLAVPPCEVQRQKRDLPIVDKVVEDIGTGLGDKIVGLETIDDQLDAIESLDPAQAIRMVLLLARTPSLGEDTFLTMTMLYRQHRAGTIVPAIEIASNLSAEDVAANRALMTTIVEKRNLVMRQRAEPLIDAGAVFIAVGALHLVGEKGLVELFRQDGYAVTRVW